MGSYRSKTRGQGLIVFVWTKTSDLLVLLAIGIPYNAPFREIASIKSLLLSTTHLTLKQNIDYQPQLWKHCSEVLKLPFESIHAESTRFNQRAWTLVSSCLCKNETYHSDEPFSWWFAHVGMPTRIAEHLSRHLSVVCVQQTSLQCSRRTRLSTTAWNHTLQQDWTGRWQS